ncbi:MAG: RecQ family ATP-dependent DNA helicase [Treponema sp.]|nr:RecQ family ATP-dependent DNA helicase [Treponema sp.]
MDSNPNEQQEIQDPLSEAVKNLFGLSYLFPYQRLVMTNMLEAAQAAGLSFKRQEAITENFWQDEVVQKLEFPNNSNALSDIGSAGRQIVILPTGAGKSLCFQLPAMLMEGITLVIYPILSLMSDQQRRLHERGFSPVTIKGGQDKEERDEIWRKLESGESSFIIANPEVLLTPQVKERLKNINVVHVVIDEAHCVSEWGESFRPSYLEIGTIIEGLSGRKQGLPLVTAFTATASAPVLEKIKLYIFNDSDACLIMGNPDRPNISYSAKGCVNRNLAVRDILIENKRPAIVFCSSRPGTEKLARYLINELAEMGHAWHSEIRFYHAGLSREEKAETEKWLLKNKEAVLCSTCAFGMGVDKSDVRTVIHRDCPPSVEAYLQESGRAGRDGEQSKAILLWGPDDESAMLRAKTDYEKQRLSSLLNYARDIEHCRRHSLLALLNYDSGGEVPEEFCCDVCEQNASSNLREEASIIDFFRRNKRCYTQLQAAAVLAENKTIRWSHDEVSIVINTLIKSGKLKRLKYFPWKGKITVSR